MMGTRGQPHGNHHSEWRSTRNHAPSRSIDYYEAQCQQAIATFMVKHGRDRTE
jgi:hypothetical protein